MSLSSSVSIALFFDIKCHYAVGDHWRDITVGIKISGGISSGCMWYNREKYEGFYIIHFLMLSTNKLCTTGIPWKPDLNFLHILPIDRQTDSINMFYVMYAESMVFIHVVTVLLAGATLFMALDVMKDFGKKSLCYYLVTTLLAWVACGIVGMYAEQIKSQAQISHFPWTFNWGAALYILIASSCIIMLVEISLDAFPARITDDHFF